jgi:2-keto-4-pentenoate hydratase/2-oxohepta-3-ene-1,7-dioic acid hydratase in catechol pathway
MVKVLSSTLSMMEIAAMSRSPQLSVIAGEGGPSIPISEAQVLAPIEPRQLIAVGANYHAHAEEAQHHVPSVPLTFGKLPSSIIGPGETILIPANTTIDVDYEAELALVIGQPTAAEANEDPLAAIFGYTCANDVSARDLQKSDGQWLRAKSFPTFTPLGPAIVTGDEFAEPDSIQVRGLLNGDLVQDATTSLMIHKIRPLMRFLLDTFILWPGDVVLTGTPAGVGAFRTPPRFLRAGDTFVVDIEGVGQLRNPVALR